MAQPISQFQIAKGSANPVSNAFQPRPDPTTASAHAATMAQNAKSAACRRLRVLRHCGGVRARGGGVRSRLEGIADGIRASLRDLELADGLGHLRASHPSFGAVV